MKNTNTTPTSEISRITKKVRLMTFQDSRLSQPPVSLSGAGRSSASPVTAFSMTRCNVVPGEGFRVAATPRDIIGKSTAMSVVNSRSRATTGSVFLDSLQDVLPPTIVHNIPYCCSSKHLTCLWAGACFFLDSAYCITSKISQLQFQRLLFNSSIVKPGTFWKVPTDIVLYPRELEIGSRRRPSGCLVDGSVGTLKNYFQVHT